MPFIIAIAVLILDQLTKYIYVAAGAPTIPIIANVLCLEYVQNKGAAWGIFAGNQLVLYIVSAIITVIIAVFFAVYYRKLGKLLRYALAIIIAGAIGNAIDRFALGYVRDMIYIEIIKFPVFNVADMGITIGGVLAVIDIIFFEKDKSALSDEPSLEKDEQQDDVSSDEKD